MPAHRDEVFLVVNGKDYTGWKEIQMTRGIDRCVSSFHLVAGGKQIGIPAAPFDVCEIFVDNDKLLTGYIEQVGPDLEKNRDDIRISGHSKTKDLTDCTPDIPSGQFAGFTVAAIMRAICALFKIEVDQRTDRADAVVQNTNLQRAEKAFQFLERLGNLSGVLLSDDELGRLVLAIAGDEKGATRLLQGGNLQHIRGIFNAAHRYSHYIVKGQSGIAGGDPYNLDGEGDTSDTPDVGEVQTAMRAEAIDPDVPRYRPHVTLAEHQLTQQQMQQRADWQKQYAYGQSIKINARVRGFRQDDGKLWKPNLMIATTIPKFNIFQDLLIAETIFTLNAQTDGHVTDLLLGPIEGYTPDPGAVKLHREKGGRAHKKGSPGGFNFDDLPGGAASGGAGV